MSDLIGTTVQYNGVPMFVGSDYIVTSVDGEHCNIRTHMWTRGWLKPFDYSVPIKDLIIPECGCDCDYSAGDVCECEMCGVCEACTYTTEEADMAKVSMADRDIRLVVAGGRDFTNYAGMCEALDKLLVDVDNTTIISGGARGVDKLGERYAKERGYALEVYPADWEKYGKSAGYRRNEQMAEVATHLVAFWDGESRGTKHMIDLGNKHGLTTRVGRY